jgi:hypothetical protein
MDSSEGTSFSTSSKGKGVLSKSAITPGFLKVLNENHLHLGEQCLLEYVEWTPSEWRFVLTQKGKKDQLNCNIPAILQFTGVVNP